MEEQKGLNKENMKKLLAWEGISKEFPWILLTLFIIFAAYGWYSDINQCKVMMKNDCYQQCRLDEITKELRMKNPGADVHCQINNQTDVYECSFAGVAGNMQPFNDLIQKTLNQINNMSLVP